MGLCLKSNKSTINIHMSYSAFNRMRYLILAYIQNEKLETVSIFITFFLRILMTLILLNTSLNIVILMENGTKNK